MVQLGSHSGLVEEVTLRFVQLRDYDGNVHFIPNNLITTVTNMSRGFAHAVMDVGVAYRESVSEALDIMRAVGAAMRADEALAPLTSFILPSGPPAVAALHRARPVAVGQQREVRAASDLCGDVLVGWVDERAGAGFGDRLDRLGHGLRGRVADDVQQPEAEPETAGAKRLSVRLEPHRDRLLEILGVRHHLGDELATEPAQPPTSADALTTTSPATNASCMYSRSNGHGSGSGRHTGVSPDVQA